LLALQHERVSRHLLFSHEELAAAAFANERTAPHALFLTAPTLFQPILSLAGRPVLRANTDWLWSHGYQFAQREADVKSIYAGSDEARALISYYGVDYVYLGRIELEAGANQSFFDEKFPTVYQSADIAIYDVSAKDLKTQPPATVVPREFTSRIDQDPYQSLTEFPRVGYAVHLFYQTALGRSPRYDEFVTDLKILGRELYVGSEGWELTLERNKQALAEEVLKRADFKNLYDDKSNASYLDALILNAGGRPTRDQRQAWSNALDNKSESRASVLKSVSENLEDKRHYNSAYLLTNYFGYLRRNPGEAPENDLTGFNFWLESLNRTGDYRSLTRAFLESDEYRDRSPRRVQAAGK
jgi:hypothetical protein